MFIFNRNLLITILVFVLISISLVVNAAPARSTCASVEQEEVVDFESLEKRIRKTKSIGVMTKLKLSNDIKKLLGELKTFQAGNSSLTLEQEREHFDLLYMKVVTMVQKKDPELFHQLCNSWDPIWVALQDEENLKKVSHLYPTQGLAIAEMADVLIYFITTIIPSANAEEFLSHDEVIKRDLFIVITLHGVHCKSVVEYKLIKNQDYVATCETGDQFHVHVSEDGRVNMVPHHLPE